MISSTTQHSLFQVVGELLTKDRLSIRNGLGTEYNCYLLTGFYDLRCLEGRISEPLKLRYSPRAGGTECQLEVKLVGKKQDLLSIVHNYPQYVL